MTDSLLMEFLIIGLPCLGIGMIVGAFMGLSCTSDPYDESSFVPPDYPKDVVDLEWERLEREHR